MPYSIPSPSNFVPITVSSPGAPDPLDLIYAGTGGTIFPGLVIDQTTGGYWYHGGNPLIPNNVQYFSNQNIVASYAKVPVISDQIEKGLFELRRGTEVGVLNPIISITLGTNTIISLAVGDAAIAGLCAGVPNYESYIEINSASPTVPSGIYEVLAVSGDDVLIKYDSSANQAFTPGTDFSLTTYVYLWDEIYTTPIGRYLSIAAPVTIVDTYSFRLNPSAKNEIQLNISDLTIIPKVGDFLVIQKFTGTAYTNEPTTDGFNSLPNLTKAETYQFEITAAVLNSPKVWTLTFDKTFETTLGEYVMFILLNRAGTAGYKELLPDTFQQYEVHREQLLGDVYNYNGTTLPKGRKNYLYYNGAEFLGQVPLLSGIIDSQTTPFIVLDSADEIKDRIYDGLGEVEVHLPTIMLNGENTPVILTNSQASLGPVKGVGSYAALTLKYSTTTKRYGWVFFDLRLIVIDDAELATSIGYNSNRNYTLPTPVLNNSVNTVQNATPNNPIPIITTSIGSPMTVNTGSTRHNFSHADKVVIVGVTNSAEAVSSNNTNGSGQWYIDKIDDFNFSVYANYDPFLDVFSDPVVGLTIGSGGVVYGIKLAYEYFFTYRLTGDRYQTLPYADLVPFNFRTGSLIDNTTGTVDIQVPQLDYLTDSANTEGFQANTYEVIIGKYKQSLSSIYDIDATDPYEDIVVMGSNNLLFAGVQANPHQPFPAISKLSYDMQVSNIPIGPLYGTDVNNPAYDIINTVSQALYKETMPSDAFTAHGIWFIGNIVYKSQAEQYKLRFTITIPAANWNGTTNPTFQNGNPFMLEKLISEVGLYVTDLPAVTTGSPLIGPYIYAKIAPVIKKNNNTDITLVIELDF